MLSDVVSGAMWNSFGHLAGNIAKMYSTMFDDIASGALVLGQTDSASSNFVEHKFVVRMIDDKSLNFFPHHSASFNILHINLTSFNTLLKSVQLAECNNVERC